MLSAPPLLDAGGDVLALEVHGTFNLDAGILAEAQEVDVDDEVAHRLELHVARDGADGLALDLEVDERREETAGLDMGENVAVGERNQLGFLLVAIDDTGNEAVRRTAREAPLPARARDAALSCTILDMVYS